MKPLQNLFKLAIFSNYWGKMGGVDTWQISIKGMPDAKLLEFLKKNAISLKVEEARKVVELI